MTESLEKKATNLFMYVTKFDMKTIVLVAKATFAGWLHHIAATKSSRSYLSDENGFILIHLNMPEG